MKRPSGDVAKLAIYFLSAFLLAALVTPWLWNAGKFLAEFTAGGSENDLLDSIGASARKADFPTYFKRALLLSGVLLLIPLISALKLGRRIPPLANSPWSIYLPRHTVAQAGGQPLRNPRNGWIHLLTGFLLAGGFLFIMGIILVSLGKFGWEEEIDWLDATQSAMGTAIGASLVEELVFRGMLLGIFLRTFRPAWAIVLLSVLFSLLHFLQPPDELQVSDPESALAGFEMLKLLGMRLLDPIPFINEFFTLLVIGIILAYARYATASLWLPIGLHAGWAFAYKLFDAIAMRTESDGANTSILVGPDIKSGLIPVATLAVTAILVHLFTRVVQTDEEKSLKAQLTDTAME